MNEWEVKIPVRGKTPELAMIEAREKISAIKLQGTKIWMVTRVELEDELDGTFSMNADSFMVGHVYFQTRQR